MQDERPGKKQGIGLMYNLLVDHGFQSPARTYLSESPSYRPPFAARFQVLPFELRYHARGDPGQAEAMANTLVARLASDDFNLARWRRLVEGGSSSFIRMQRQPTTRATLYRWSSLFGVNHPVLGRWQGDPRTADQIKYKDIQKFHRQLAKTGHTHILAAGEMEINPLADTLNLVFGGREKFTPCQAEPPPRLLTTIQGAVFSAFDQEDVRLTLSFPPLAAGGKTGPGWAEVQLLEEVLRMSLYNRLRLEAGVIYTVGVVARKGDGCLVPEIYTSCLPTRAPEVLTAMRDLLRDLISTGVGEETLLRVQLRMAGRLLRHLTEPANGYEMLREMVSCGEVPLDPLAALLDVTALELNDFLLRCISPERFVFSVTGPLFAEDIDLFLTR